MLPATWYPRQVAGLVRVGPVGDGGYVIPEIVLGHTDTLLSFGLGTDWRFEEDFRERTGCSVHCFDHTVTPNFWKKKQLLDFIRLVAKPINGKTSWSDLLLYSKYKKFFSGKDVHHHQLMIGYDGEGSISMASAMKRLSRGRVFLKCDIEGAEWRILDDILSSRDDLVGFAMELHDVDLHRDRLTRFIEDQHGFDLVHIHPNNFGGTDPNGDPISLEATFLRSDLTAQLEPRDDFAYPIEGLDSKNDDTAPDLPLVFEKTDWISR